MTETEYRSLLLETHLDILEFSLTFVMLRWKLSEPIFRDQMGPLWKAQLD